MNTRPRRLKYQYGQRRPHPLPAHPTHSLRGTGHLPTGGMQYDGIGSFETFDGTAAHDDGDRLSPDSNRDVDGRFGRPATSPASLSHSPNTFPHMPGTEPIPSDNGDGAAEEHARLRHDIYHGSRPQSSASKLSTTGIGVLRSDDDTGLDRHTPGSEGAAVVSVPVVPWNVESSPPTGARQRSGPQGQRTPKLVIGTQPGSAATTAPSHRKANLSPPRTFGSGFRTTAVAGGTTAFSPGRVGLPGALPHSPVTTSAGGATGFFRGPLAAANPPVVTVAALVGQRTSTGGGARGAAGDNTHTVAPTRHTQLTSLTAVDGATGASFVLHQPLASDSGLGRDSRALLSRHRAQRHRVSASTGALHDVPTSRQRSHAGALRTGRISSLRGPASVQVGPLHLATPDGHGGGDRPDHVAKRRTSRRRRRPATGGATRTRGKSPVDTDVPDGWEQTYPQQVAGRTARVGSGAGNVYPTRLLDSQRVVMPGKEVYPVPTPQPTPGASAFSRPSGTAAKPHAIAHDTNAVWGAAPKAAATTLLPDALPGQRGRRDAAAPSGPTWQGNLPREIAHQRQEEAMVGLLRVKPARAAPGSGRTGARREGPAPMPLPGAAPVSRRVAPSTSTRPESKDAVVAGDSAGAQQATQQLEGSGTTSRVTPPPQLSTTSPAIESRPQVVLPHAPVSSVASADGAHTLGPRLASGPAPAEAAQESSPDGSPSRVRQAHLVEQAMARAGGSASPWEADEGIHSPMTQSSRRGLDNGTDVASAVGGL